MQKPTVEEKNVGPDYNRPCYFAMSLSAVSVGAHHLVRLGRPEWAVTATATALGFFREAQLGMGMEIAINLRRARHVLRNRNADGFGAGWI